MVVIVMVAMFFVGNYDCSCIIGAVKVEGTGYESQLNITTEIASFIYLFFEIFFIGKILAFLTSNLFC